MKTVSHDAIDIALITRRAQKLQAEALADGAKRLIAWVKTPRSASSQGGHQSA